MTDTKQRACEDCGEDMAVGENRKTCKNCGLKCCPYCFSHIHKMAELIAADKAKG